MHIDASAAEVNYRRPRKPREWIKRCLIVVGRHYGLTPTEVREKRRRRRIAHARQLVAWMAYQTRAYSLLEIGRQLGGFDHTTIIHSVRRTEERRQDVTYRLLSDSLLEQARNYAPEPPPAPEPETTKSFVESRIRQGDLPTLFYEVGPHDPRYWRSFLVEQNERFCAAMREAGE